MYWNSLANVYLSIMNDLRRCPDFDETDDPEGVEDKPGTVALDPLRNEWCKNLVQTTCQHRLGSVCCGNVAACT